MKKNYFLKFFFFLLFITSNLVNGQSGIHQTYIIIDINNDLDNDYYDLFASTGNPDFNGLDLGIFTPTSTLELVSFQNIVDRCNTDNITDSKLYYRIYNTLVSTPPSFIPIQTFNVVSVFDNPNCNATEFPFNDQRQTWEYNSTIIDVLNGLSSGNYFLEVYSTSDYEWTSAGGGSGTHVADNSGTYYRASFKVDDPPVANCVAPFTVFLDASGNATITTSDIDSGSTDDFDTPTLSIDINSFDCSDAGNTITITLTAEDSLGQTDSCTTDVTIVDNEDPTIDSISDEYRNLLPNQGCERVINYAGDLNFLDNCSGAILTQTAGIPSGDPFPVGTTTNTFVVTDASGNTDSMSFDVIVSDNLNPTASNPIDINVECFSDIPAPDITVVTDEDDNCDGTPTVAFVSDDITSATCDGDTVTVLRTYSVTDNSNNSINVTQTINVDDLTNPTASNPAVVNVECFSDIPTPDVTVVTDEDDNCDGTPTVAFVSDDITSASCDGDAVTVTRTYSVTDCSGNSINVIQTINVDDVTNPTASNPAVVNVECFSDIPAPDVTVVTDEDDNCLGTPTVAFVSDDITSATCDGDTVTVLRTYSVTDCSGNSINVTQTINVDDVTNPTASNPAVVNVECFSDIPAPDVTVVTDEDDNCLGTPTVAFVSDDITSATCDGDTVTVLRTYSVTDCSGNSINVTQTINVDDVTNPTASNPAVVNVECFSDIPAPDVAVVTDEDDNCLGTPTVAFVSDDITSATCDGDTVTVLRTYSVTDCSGNSINVTQTINVDDVTNPTASNPAVVNVECFSDIPAPDVTEVTDEDDNCDGTPTVAFVSDDITSATCDGDTVTVLRTYSVTDCSGNSINVTQTINVDDVTNPTASNPAVVNVECFSDIPAPDVTVVTDEDDNCDGTPTVAFVSDDITSATCDGDTVTVLRTYSVTDCSGNSINVTQTINVDDVTDPTASNPAVVNVECFSDIPAPDVTVVTDEDDNCLGTPTVAFVSDDITSATCDGDTVTVLRTYSVTDCSGNSINVTQTINVDDVTDPTASNPAVVNVECFSDIPAPDVTVVTDEDDNCLGTPTVAFVSDDITSATCDGDTVTVTRTYSVTDCSGNSINVFQTINVDDVTNPTASNPAVVNVECFSDIPAPDVTVVTDEDDNCLGTPTVAFVSDDITSATCDGDTVTVTRTYSVSDCSGNSINVTQTINVDDVTDPTASNPAVVNVECFSDIPAPDVTVVTDEDDNCDGTPTVAFVSDDITSATCDGDTVTVLRTYSVTDCSGNSINVTQTINVDDVTDPTASNPAVVNVECFSDIPAPDVTVVTDEDDNCLGTPTVAFVSDDITSASCDGDTVTVLRTYSVTDCSGNSINVTQTINVDDVTDPTASNPAVVNVECFSDIPAPDVTVVTDEDDNCLGTPTVAFVSDDITSATCDGDTVTVTRTYSVTDCSGNSINVFQTINVDDVTNPTASNPAVVNVECFSDIPAPDVTVVTDEDDNCLGTPTVAFVSDDITSATCDGDTVTVTRTYSVSDCSGNSINVTQTINVLDTTPPSITLPGTITIECTESTDPANTGSALSNDNCDLNPTITYSDSSTQTNNSSCTDFTYTITRTWTATDCNNNATSGIQIINVEDSTPPGFTNSGFDLTLECDGSGNSAAFNTWLSNNGGATASDSCGTVTWSNNYTSLNNACGATGAVTIRFTATDNCGNESFSDLIFTIEDTTNPVITTSASDLTVECDGSGNTTDLTNWINSNGGAVATDVCSNITWTNNFTALSDLCGATGAATVAFTATDDCGNSSETIATFTIEDTDNPVLNTPSDITIECTESILPANTGDATGTETCGVATFTFTDNSTQSNNSSCSDYSYTITRTWTATDSCGNSISEDQIITVEDSTAPDVIAPNAVSLECSSDLPAAATTIAQFNALNGASASDNCTSTANLQLSSSTGTLSGNTYNGTIIRTYTITDSCGNDTTVDHVFNINDTTPPTAICQDFTIALNPSTGVATVSTSDINNGSNDNCGIASYLLSQTSFGCNDIGDNPVVLTVTDFNGNDSTCNAIVTITDLSDTASVTIDAAQTTFCEQASVTFTAIPFDGGLSPSYQWYVNGTPLIDGIDVSGATTSVLTTSNSFANSDQITVEMTTSISACSITVVSNPLTLTVNEARPVTFNINASTSAICPGGEVTFSVNPSLITNGGTNPDFQWLVDNSPVSGETSSSFTTSTLTDGQIVTLEVTSYVQCANPVPATNSNPITITVNPLPTVTATSNATNDTICFGDSVILTGAGASTYSWDNGVSDGVAFTPASTQTYTVTGTDANGCENTSTIEIIVNPLPTVIANSNATNDTICFGDSVILTGAGASTYSWDNGVSDGVAFTPASTQTYTVTGTDANGCENTSTIEIIVNPLPTVTANSNAANDTICLGDSVTLTGNGASTYTWDNGVSDGVAFTPASTQTYTVTGTDANGCENTSTIEIIVNPLPTVSASSNATNDTICLGDSVTLTGNGASTYTWDNGVSDGVAFTPASTQTYTVTGTDANGCENTSTIEIIVNPLPTVIANSNATNDTICFGDSVILTGAGASTYSWDNGVSDGVAFTPASTQTYTVTGTDANGCENTSTIEIIVNPLPTVIANSNATNDTICFGDSVTLTGNGASTYTWDNGVSDGVAFTPASTQTYTVTGTDANGCENTSTIEIIVNPLPTVTANSNAANDTICLGDSVTLTGNGASTYTWDNGVSDGVAFTPASTQTYTVTGTDANGCENTSTIEIIVNPVPSLTTSNGNVCVSGQTSIDLSTLVSSNGTTITYYNSQANADNGTSAINSTVTPSISPTTYYVRSEFATDCYVTDTIQITIEPLPTVIANATNLEICSGDPVTLSGSGASSYTWDNGVTNGVAFSPTTTQTYTVTGINSNGCENTDTITITVYPNAPTTPSIITGNPSNCPVAPGLVYSVTDDSNAINYNWTIPSGYTITSGSGTHSITVTATTTAVTGDFVVTATNPCGTSASSTLEVTIGDVALATAGADQYVCVGTPSITLDGFVGGAIAPKSKNVWQWSDNGAGGTLPSCNGNQIPCLTGNYILPTGASAGDVITISIETIDPGGSCGAAYDEMQIFILADPTATISGGTTICEGGNSNITFNATPNTTVTYNNGASNQTISIDGSGTATINSGTLSTTTTFSLISVGYTNNTACTQAISGSAIITVNPDATISTSSNTNQTVCIDTNIAPIDYAIGGGGTGATISGLPAGLSFNSSTYIISGSPTETGTFNYTVNTTGTCLQTSATGTITVNPDATISTSSNTNQTLCINSAISDIDYAIGGGGTGATITGLPNGLSFNSSTYTISGSPTESGTFNYTVTTTGTCQQITATGTINVNPDATISTSSNTNQTVCINSAISDINYTISGGGTGATITGLPAGLSFNSSTYIISGSPTETGSFNYTVNTTGTCLQTSATGTITITPDATISTSSNTNQTVCINTSISDIDYAIGAGGTGATITGLPNGLSFNSSTYTISGSPTESGTFNYTVTTTGTCQQLTATGTITVNPDATINAPSNNIQTVCINTAISAIDYAIGGGGTGATITGLPNGLSFNSSTYIISGSPTETGTFSYTIITTGTCQQTSATGIITINPDATISAPSNNIQTVCINTAISAIDYAIGGGGTGATISGLPNGLTFNSSTYTISGSPTESGTFNYTITTTGTCQQPNATGTIVISDIPIVDAGVSLTICSDNTATMDATIGGSATSGLWSTSGTGSFSDNSETAVYTPSTNDINNETVTLTYTTTDATAPCNNVSDSIILTIKEAVQITTQPSNIGVCDNENASFSVVAYADDLSYQWYKDGNPITGATSNTLNFNPAFLADAGNYYVEVSGNSVCAPLDSDTVTLNVNQLISVTDEPDDLDLCEGSTAVFSVAATGAIASYQWRKDGVNLSGETNATLTINNITPSNDGNYDVVIIGVGGTCPTITSDFATLNVTLQPTASISYTSTSYCMSFAGPESVNLSGANAYTGGVFSSTSGLSINASTGAITPSTSTPGTYTVEYLLPASICTTINPTTTVTIYPVTIGGEALGYLDTESISFAREVITVCHMGDGAIVASGYTGNINEWQSSTDGGVTWTSINETTSSIDFVNITDTTVYRAVIESGNCGVEYTSRVILNVIPPDVKPDPVQVSSSTICFPDTVTFSAQSGLGTGLGLEDGGGDFNTGQLNTQDPDSWLVDGNPGGWTANGDNTAPNDWSGTNPHTFPGGIFYDTGATSGPRKFGIANGPLTSVLETPIFNTYALTAFEFQMDQTWNLMPGDQILIELSLDGGLTYNVVLFDVSGPDSGVNHDHFGDNHYVFTEDVDGNSLESFLGQDNLRIRFTYSGTHANSVWAIDNIQFEVDEGANGIEWTDDQGTVISTEHTAVHSPSFPGIHTYGVTSLIDDCRSEGVAGTEFIDVNVNWTDAGPDQVIAQSDCGNNTVTLNAYDNTLTVAQNFANGTWGAYDASDPESQHPGTGDIGTWSVTSGPTSTCGTGTFSDLNDPRATFTGEPGTYVLRYTVGACYDEVTIDLTSCNTIDFDGVNDHITFFDNYPLNGPFSLEVWIKSEVNNGSTQTILSKRNANSQVDGYDLRLVNRRISFNWNNGQSITSPFNINTDRWYHIAVSFNGSLYKLYIDGIEVNSVSGSAPTTNSNECILGGMDKNGPPKNYFNGWMDELRIWNKALSKEHIRHMMNQEIEDGGAVVGSVLGLNIEGPDTNNDNVDDNVISWSNLLAYYKMNNLGCGYLYPNNTTGIDGKLRNINTVQPQTAPLPYTTIADGDWTDVSGSTPWLYGNSVWDYPNSNGVNGAAIDWNIVRASHDLNSGNKNIYLLGLLLDTPGKTLKIFNPSEAQNENNSGYELFISHYLQLEGSINLIGESQLIQKRYDSDQLSGSYYDPAGVGFIKRDQQGTTNLFNYNYWSSPVSATTSTILNEDYSISTILQDGTLTTNPMPVGWTGSYNATGSTLPITLSNRWIYAYENYPNDIDPWLTYAEWRFIGNTGTLATGLGFTMKGSGVGDPINDVQNYAFVGKPHNGTITNPITSGNEAVVGNPYPSAIDSHEFINDNIPGSGTGSIDGTLYFWEHYESNFTHILEDYEGGYATYNLTGGLGAYMPPLISGTGSSSKIPGRYIPVGQGFFVSALISTGGDVTFRNNQRIFQRESSGISVFMKAPTNSQASENNSSEDPDLVKRVRINFSSSNGYVRPLLLGFVSNGEATDGYDFGYDSPVTDVFSNDMYWTIDESPYAIQGVGEFDNTKQYPVEVVVTNPGNITISLQDLENFDSEIDVFIHDALNGTYFQINHEDFQIDLNSGLYTNRFYITFIDEGTLNTEELDQLDSMRLYYLHDTKEIYINWVNSYEIEEVRLINLLGQTVREWTDIEPLNQREIKIPVRNLSEGSYVITVTNSYGKSTNKKVIIKQ